MNICWLSGFLHDNHILIILQTYFHVFPDIVSRVLEIQPVEECFLGYVQKVFHTMKHSKLIIVRPFCS